MSNGFLSQEEIDSLLNGGGMTAEPVQEEILSDIEKDLLGEIGNISMGSASTALSTIINQQVNITTPVVSVTTLKSLKDNFQVPNIALEVKYTSGIMGENLLVMKITDAAVIANLMMGGNGVAENTELSEIEISAVSEAMNQMIGSAATSMATMFSREVNISPPESRIWSDASSNLSDNINDNEDIILVSFRLTIGDLVDSNIMQLLPVETAKKIVSIMMGTETSEPTKTAEPTKIEETAKPQETQRQETHTQQRVSHEEPQSSYYQEPVRQQPPVEVQKAAFQPLGNAAASAIPKNIDLILDVPLEISVVLGRTRKNIKDILSLGTGSLIELDKLAEEPVEILVNGKRVAYGEVVVVDENFGVRITSIVSSAERVKSLRE
ncbi:flagellar motor switch phosphatase FliY [Clostridium omnivorum]|uniref:Flagellar motor switch phosphatase FliY n=1 Tax=Clostridium omnivorum TaxID=1604902 RepID=A0ABQ5NB97_9CLOT|nr:flagellar motor switch phosphatase FliY [Clostridium sp. E14]GLC32320.1 flagellar motor switch phosphatase FliY [Clostridium sp. E14]